MSYSFEELCLPCYPELVAYATKRTQNKAAAEDIVQESVLRAFTAWDKWEPRGNPAVWARAWMFTIVSNLFSIYYKRNKRHTKAVTQESKALIDRLYGNDVEEHPYQRIQTIGDEVRDALDRIKPEWAAVIRLVYIEGVQADEAARILNLAPGTVRSQMARGRLALARILAPYAKQRFGYDAAQAAHA
jgi:RNA polymerase sigma-70 factor (ECF subfamily)